MNFLVIGEKCRDVFVYGEVTRLSPEAPVPPDSSRGRMPSVSCLAGSRTGRVSPVQRSIGGDIPHPILRSACDPGR